MPSSGSRVDAMERVENRRGVWIKNKLMIDGGDFALHAAMRQRPEALQADDRFIDAELQYVVVVHPSQANVRV